MLIKATTAEWNCVVGLQIIKCYFSNVRQKTLKILSFVRQRGRQGSHFFKKVKRIFAVVSLASFFLKSIWRNLLLWNPNLLLFCRLVILSFCHFGSCHCTPEPWKTEIGWLRNTKLKEPNLSKKISPRTIAFRPNRTTPLPLSSWHCDRPCIRKCYSAECRCHLFVVTVFVWTT